MKKLIIISLIFNCGYLAALSPFTTPTSTLPTVPTSNTTSLASSKSATPAVPAWMNTSPWFGDSTNTVALDSSLGDSNWATLNAAGGQPSGAPGATPSPFAAPSEDIPAGPQGS